MTIKSIIDRINKSTELSEKYNEILAQIYLQIPSGSCEGCAKCCSESVNVSLIELANIINNGIVKMSDSESDKLNKKLIEFYLTEWIKPNACPFLDDEKKCTIYDVRPLPCRVFGTPAQDAYEENYNRIRKQNLTFAKSLYTYEGIKLSTDVLTKKIDFCNDFVPDRRLDNETVEELYSSLINLDGKLYFDGIIDEPLINGDLVTWMLEFLVEDATENKKTNPAENSINELEQGLSKSLLYDLKIALSKSI